MIISIQDHVKPEVKTITNQPLNREVIYQEFLKHRELTADRIMKLTNIPESSVYKALDRLYEFHYIYPKSRLTNPDPNGGARIILWTITR